ncbi:hypothetical protein [Polyangium aurulentum]|uniref:hypothetical protein n=1 Tax=Polyangium aurulentum TaxID=2567896 RepID=UPI00198251EA|nr:hypothetical protein [Polyangium aurulentum]UQA61487.1 hypothetical protein E8A73_013840 [Polyangium aurulentum]
MRTVSRHPARYSAVALTVAMALLVPRARADEPATTTPAAPPPSSEPPTPPSKVQGTVGLTLGAAGIGLEHRFWERTVFQMGLRGDVLFGRGTSTDFGVGPYLEVSTLAFDEIQFGGGISTLFPVTQALPLVVSAGGYGRYGGRFGSEPYALEPGVAGALFFGSRSYNYHAGYVMAAGLLAQFRYGLGASGETSIIVGAQLDLVALSLPFQLLVNALRGGSPSTKAVQ